MAAYVGHSGDDDPAPPLGRGPTRWLGDWSPGVQIAKVETNRGVLSFALLSKQAPVAVASFTRLAREGYFDGLLVHRVVADFVIQSGDPSGSGWGGPGYTLADEFGPLPFSPGSLGMARVEKDSAGSQWFVTHSAQPHLDGRYTLFGQLFDGFDVLAQIRRGDRVKSVRILP
ncbi:MAG: peptidylprolyl isomerase [Rickettsiales bacterium]|nr:peptidylprolyl isomerase [Rickettsiales bacterium]